MCTANLRHVAMQPLVRNGLSLLGAGTDFCFRLNYPWPEVLQMWILLSVCVLHPAAPSVKFILSKKLLTDSAFHLLDSPSHLCGSSLSACPHPCQPGRRHRAGAAPSLAAVLPQPCRTPLHPFSPLLLAVCPCWERLWLPAPWALWL